MSTPSSPSTVYNQSAYDPYAQTLLDPYSPTPMPTSEVPVVPVVPVAKENTCLIRTVVTIGAFAFIAGLSFTVGCVAAAIFSGPILATGLWLATFMTTGVAVTLATRTIGKELGCSPFSIKLIEVFTDAALIVFARIAGEELGVL